MIIELIHDDEQYCNVTTDVHIDGLYMYVLDIQMVLLRSLMLKRKRIVLGIVAVLEYPTSSSIGQERFIVSGGNCMHLCRYSCDVDDWNVEDFCNLSMQLFKEEVQFVFHLMDVC